MQLTNWRRRIGRSSSSMSASGGVMWKSKTMSRLTCRSTRATSRPRMYVSSGGQRETSILAMLPPSVGYRSRSASADVASWWS